VLRSGDAAGDWHCPKCGNVNWAKRNSCNVCKASKNDLVENTKREGSGGGFSEIDEEELRRKKRRREDEERETKRRKVPDPGLGWSQNPCPLSVPGQLTLTP
jgi:hypothetical protein